MQTAMQALQQQRTSSESRQRCAHACCVAACTNNALWQSFLLAGATLVLSGKKGLCCRSSFMQESVHASQLHPRNAARINQIQHNKLQLKLSLRAGAHGWHTKVLDCLVSRSSTASPAISAGSSAAACASCSSSWMCFASLLGSSPADE